MKTPKNPLHETGLHKRKETQMKTPKNLLHALFLVCLVAALPLGALAAAPPPTPPTPTEEDIIPGPLGSTSPVMEILRGMQGLKLGARAQSLRAGR